MRPKGSKRKSDAGSHPDNPSEGEARFDVIDLPEIAAEDELPEHAEPTFSQQVAHARALIRWNPLSAEERLARRRELMHSERFVL